MNKPSAQPSVQPSAQNYQNAEDTALIDYIEAQKIAAELAASAKNICISIHRSSRAIKHKSAANLFTFAPKIFAALL